MSVIEMTLVFFLVGRQIEQEMINSKVVVSIEMKGLLLLTRNEMRFQNRGAETIETSTYVVPSHHLHMFRCYNGKKELKSEKLLQNLQNFATYRVLLDSMVEPNRQFTFECLTVCVGEIQTALKKREIDEDQILKYNADISYFSVHHTLYIESTIVTNSDLVLENSIIPTKTTRDSITYETFHVKPYFKTLTALVYINNNPLLVVKNLKRQISVSHFGKIFIEDSVAVENIGSRLVGLYLNPPTKATTDVLFTHLPSFAENIKYFDGNSSKSQIYDFINFKTLAFKLRYPLLGGWKTNYILQYDVPTHEYLFTSLDKFTVLRIRPLDHIRNDALVENVLVKIVLPEGATLNTFKLTKQYLNVISKERECFGGMCFLERHVIVLNGPNLFHDYIEEIEVNYYLLGVFMFKAPFLIGFYIEVVFLFVIFLRK